MKKKTVINWELHWLFEFVVAPIFFYKNHVCVYIGIFQETFQIKPDYRVVRFFFERAEI